MTADVADIWGRLNVPDSIPVVDGLLAATALVRGWTLVTRNTADVASMGVRLLDPFTWTVWLSSEDDLTTCWSACWTYGLLVGRDEIFPIFQTWFAGLVPPAVSGFGLIPQPAWPVLANLELIILFSWYDAGPRS